MSTIKEDGTSMLTESAAQDYIHELESHLRIMRDKRSDLISLVDDYQSKKGFYLVAKDFLMTVITEPDVMDIIKDEVLDGLPDLDDLESRISDIEYEYENKPDEYEVVDNVIDSMTFESKVREIIAVALQDISIETKIDTTNLE